MKSIEELKQEFKKDYPTLKNGSDEIGYKELSLEEYETTIASWAQAALAEEQALVEAAAAEAAKASAKAKLEALGLTTDDLKALGLGTN